MINVFVFTNNKTEFVSLKFASGVCSEHVSLFVKKSAYSNFQSVVVVIIVAKSTQMQESKKHNECASSVTSLNCVSTIRRPEPKPFVRTASCSRHPPCLDDSQTLSSAHSWPDDPFDGLLEALSIIPERERNGPPTCFGFENHVDDQLNQP